MHPCVPYSPRYTHPSHARHGTTCIALGAHFKLLQSSFWVLPCTVFIKQMPRMSWQESVIQLCRGPVQLDLVRLAAQTLKQTTGCFTCTPAS